MKESDLAPPYTVLAGLYDVVMEHVDYHMWARYVHELIGRYLPHARQLLELGCGTGSLALELQALGPYKYLATDRSSEMLEIAREKAERERIDIQFKQADFTAFEVDRPRDAILLLYDGLNYLLDVSDVARVLARAHEVLNPGGVFIFDQSTPANSLNNEVLFQDKGSHEGVSYVRASKYDPDRRLHVTSFEFTEEGRVFGEEHVQRAYTIEEVRVLIEANRWDEVHAYDGFSMTPATDASERIHWLLRTRDVA